MREKDPIFVAGHKGLVGSAIVRRLKADGFSNLLLRERNQLDLVDQAAVAAFFETEKPAYVFLAAAKVGGIHANATYPGEFIHENLAVQTNVIHSAWKHGVRRLLFLGSSCIFPRDCPQPIREEYLLTGPLEPSNEPYAIAKIAGLKMCDAYRKQYGFESLVVMPTNLYGPGDNYDLQSSHVLPALIRRFHEAKISGAREVVLWGSGKPRREFLHVDDLADATVFLMKRPDLPHTMVNVGVGVDVSIVELASIVARIVGYSGGLSFDTGKPDGTPRKLLDVSRMTALGWEASIGLEDGIGRTYQDFLRVGGARLGTA